VYILIDDREQLGQKEPTRRIHGTEYLYTSIIIIILCNDHIIESRISKTSLCETKFRSTEAAHTQYSVLYAMR